MRYRGNHHRQHPNRALVKIEDVHTKEDARYYLGHRVLYLYRARKAKDNQGNRELRVIAGTVVRAHGNNGAVRVKFKPHVPPQAFGRRCRIMMWPKRGIN